MNLNQNQKILAVVIALIVIGGVVALSLSGSKNSVPSYGTTNTSAPSQPLPKNVDGITDAIIDETLADQAALDREAAGEDAEIQKDSQSVNDLGNSYDENSY